MVEAGNDVGNVLAHVRFDEPWCFVKLWGGVGEIGGNNTADISFFISLVELVQTASEEWEGNSSKDAIGFALFELIGQIKDAVARSQDIIRDQNVFAFHVNAQIFMRDDGIATINDGGIITTFVE